MNKKLILNHKSYLSVGEIEKYKKEFELLNINSLDIILFPSVIYLTLFKGSKCFVGAQNFYSCNYGNYTGEINLEALKSLGVGYTLVNHFERINLCIDSRSLVKEKIYNSLSSGLSTVLMVGEPKKNKNPFVYIKRELVYYLKNIDSSKIKNLSILYEPSWKEEPSEIDINLIRSVVVQIKEYFIGRYKLDVDVYYASGVNEENIINILEFCDGVAIGKDSANIEYVKNIISKLDKEMNK